MLKRFATRLASFRPHIHTESCVVCKAAALEEQSCSVVPNTNEKMDHYTAPFTLNQDTIRHGTLPTLAFDEGAEDVVGHTVEAWREAGLKKWLVLRQQTQQKVTANGKESRAKRHYDAYVAHPEEATKEMVEGAAQYLDTFCKRRPGRSPERALATPSSTETLLSFRASFTIPLRVPVETPVPEKINEAHQNDFIQHLRKSGLTFKEIEHQEKFQKALLAFQRVAVEATQLPFFLSCGTALGARREQYFIPHDDDIDIGVFYKDTVLHGVSVGHQRDEETQQFTRDPFSPHSTAKASQCVSRLLADLTNEGQFVIFDICGTVDKGLEVRLLHASTGVRIDVNWYYPPLLDTADTILVKEKGNFVWSATYYEQAGQRRHGMYRYLHTSLLDHENSLEPLFFCGRSRENTSLYFWTPKENYLLECFGEDWRIPKAYTYVEGLEGEFTNIIKE